MKGISPVVRESAMVLVAAVLTIGVLSGVSTALRLTGETGPGREGIGEMQIMVSSSRGSTSPKSVSSSKGNENVRIEDEDDHEDDECVVFLNPCPLTNPRCGLAIINMDISCKDARCTPESCVRKEELEKASSSRKSSAPSIGPNSCILQTFSCAEGALPSCFRRVRSMQLDCTDRRCTTSTCIPASVFFASQELQPWDLGKAEGPFPRTETMCVIQQTACPPNDPSCLSPVSLEQIECKDCTGTKCTRFEVLVDERDNILGNAERENEEGETGSPTESRTSARSSAQSQATARTVPQTAPLGCFTESGLWTTDRTACAPDQNRFLEQTDTVPTITVTPPPEIIEREIERKLVPDTTRSSLIQTLLSSIFDASERLNSLLRLPLSDELRLSITDTAEWLKNVQREAQEPDRNMHDLQELAGSVRTRLGDIQAAVSEWSSNQPTPTRDPNSLTDKMDSIFGGLAAAFGMVQKELIPLPSSVLSDYSQALSSYEGLKPACLANPNICGQLSSVVELLESVVAGLQQTLEEAGRQDLIEQIDAIL